MTSGILTGSKFGTWRFLASPFLIKNYDYAGNIGGIKVFDTPNFSFALTHEPQKVSSLDDYGNSISLGKGFGDS